MPPVQAELVERVRAPVEPPDPYRFKNAARSLVVAAGFCLVRDTSGGLLEYRRGKLLLYLTPQGWSAVGASGNTIAKGSGLASLRQYLELVR